jgi:hypothetical protein
VRPMRRPPERRVGRQGEIGDARGAKARLDRLDVGGAGAGHVGRALAQALRFLHLSPRLIDQRQTELDLAGPGTPTTLSALPEAEIWAAPPGAALRTIMRSTSCSRSKRSGVQTRSMSV